MRYLACIVLTLAMAVVMMTTGGSFHEEAWALDQTAVAGGRADSPTINFFEEAPLTSPGVRTFHCGTEVCNARVQYCEVIKTDVPAISNTYACQQLPRSCLSAIRKNSSSCDCFPLRTRCDFCSKLKDNRVEYLQRSCIGGGAGNRHLPR